MDNIAAMGSWSVVIHPQVREWLHELRRQDRATLGQIAKALDVVLDSGWWGQIRGVVQVVSASNTAGRAAIRAVRKGGMVLMPTYDRKQFMDEFDVNETDVEAAGARIDAYVQGWNLAQMRKDAGITQVQLAHTLGVNQSRVSAIEHGDPDTMALSTIRAYVEALGGKLRLAAEFGDHQIQFPAAT